MTITTTTTTIAKKTAHLVTALCFGVTLVACGGSGGSGGDDGGGSTGISKTAVLENTATILAARYTAFSQQSVALAGAVTTLCAAPNSGALELAQLQWKTSMDRWQQIAAIGFGPAATDSRTTRIHSFPTQISTEVSAHADIIISGSSTISEQTVASDANAFQGLNSLEYVLFSDDILLNSRQCELAAALANNVSTLATALTGDWNNYSATFVAPTNADSNTESLLTSLINYLVMMQTRKLIDAVDNEINIESPFADVSIANIRANVGLLEELVGSATDNGFAHYLSSNGANAAGNELTTRLLAMNAALDAIDTELVAARSGDTADVNVLADAVHQVAETMADDVARGFGVTVEFSSGDGD